MPQSQTTQDNTPQEQPKPAPSIFSRAKAEKAAPRKRDVSVLTRRRGRNVVTPTMHTIPLPTIARCTYDRSDRERFSRFGVPASLLKPVDFDPAKFIKDLHFSGPYGSYDVLAEKQLKTAHRILDPRNTRPWTYLIQSSSLVTEAKQLVLYGLYKKRIPFQWFKVSEYGNSPIVVPEGCKAVVLHNLSDLDHHRKIEKVRDILCEVPPECMVFIIIEGSNGVSHFTKHFSSMVNGGFLNLEFQRQTVTV